MSNFTPKKLLIIGTLVTICAVLVIMAMRTPPDNPTDNDNKIYSVKISNNSVFLFYGDEVIKQYDIDISVLPGEDIKLLTDGIKVDSEAEADILAEDYDG